jgi:pimeloyl-ACP methyl ester carboxylesterase
MLHGGPGDAISPWSYAVFRPWLKYFTVVQWDQRGSGQSYAKSGTTGLSAAQLAKDGVELAGWLCTTLHKKKIIVVGHSWGSVLGLLMVQARPELFSVFAGSGQVGADAATATKVGYEQLVKKAAQVDDARAIRELRDIGPPPWTRGNAFGVQHKWANFFEGADLFLGEMLGLALVAPGSSIKDINAWWDGELATGEVLGFTPVPRGNFRVPLVVIQGAEDVTTPTVLAREWLQSIQAPHKEFVTIEGAGHFAMFVKRDEFLRLMVAKVLPLANANR